MLSKALDWLKGIVAGALASVAAFFAGMRFAHVREERERAERERDETQKTLETLREVKSVHDIIERDPAERGRVRDKYK